MMDIKPLHNERDYDWAIREVSRYFESEPEPGTADGDRFEVLSTLIKAYEDEHFTTKHGDPVDVLHFAIESMGRSQAEFFSENRLPLSRIMLKQKDRAR